jgi:acyl carrier protein
MEKISEQEILKLIQKALELEDHSINLESSAEDFEEWDSLGNLSILVALDEALDKKVAPIKEMGEAYSVPKILQLLKNHSLIL